jgi:hypothetical protein
VLIIQNIKIAVWETILFAQNAMVTNVFNVTMVTLSKIINVFVQCKIVNNVSVATFCTSCHYPFVPNEFLNMNNYIESNFKYYDIQLGNKCIPQFYQMTICSVPNCAACNTPRKCSLCSPGYSLNVNNTCTKNVCQIPTVNFVILTLLFVIFVNQDTPIDTYVGQKCILIPQNYSCNIDACNLCSPTNPNICLNCSKHYVLNSSGLC